MAEKTVVYVLGPTCSGKSVLLDAARCWYGAKLGLVEVGKYFREKYLPGYFKGQANPEHTRQEALDVYATQLYAALDTPGVEVVFVDGQPRESQVDPILACLPELHRVFVHLNAPLEVRQRRAQARFPNDAASRLLAMQRADNDRRTYYEVLVRLLELKIPIQAVDTSVPAATWTTAVLNHVELNRSMLLRVQDAV